MRVAFLIVVGLVLSGCGTIVWNKAGATSQDYATDSYTCERDERSAGLVPGSIGAEGFGERCMEAHGWRKSASR